MALLACGTAGALAIAGILAGDDGPVRPARSDPDAVRLLRAAADAARRVPYEGRRFLTTWNRRKPATSMVQVSHAPGESIRYEAGTSAGSYQAGIADTSGFTAETLGLLTRNYSVVRSADGLVCGRRARVVEARRADGSAAGRFWIDSETGLILYRELIDATGNRVAATGFTEVRVSPPGDERAGLRAGVRAVQAEAAPWEDRLGAGELDDLRRHGWPVPRSLPGRLTLYEARRETSGGAVHLSYSDGLAAVSVFVQRGSLDERRLTGWQKTVRRGRTIFRRESLRRWAVSAGDGYVYTVLTDAPQSTADEVAEGLPHDRVRFWNRLGRGAGRIAASVNPFG